MLRIASIILVVALGGGAALIGGAYMTLERWAAREVSLEAPRTIELPPGQGLRRFSARLAEAGLVSHAEAFYYWMRLVDRRFGRFQAGLYRFAGPTSPTDVVARIIAGEIYTPIAVQFTIPEGFAMPQIAARLARHDIGTSDGNLALMRDPEFIAGLGLEAPTLEGYLYPATYSFTRQPTAQQALGRLVQTFLEKLPPNYAERVQQRGLSLHEAVTFASLVERETSVDDERGKISEVIWRRLADKTPIGIDAAIIYGIEDYQGDIRRSHLRDASNPYNTRIHSGLPPTPIGSASRASLEAVLDPTDEGYYYFVVDWENRPRHHFSKTLKEHRQHVDRLVQATRRR